MKDFKQFVSEEVLDEVVSVVQNDSSFPTEISHKEEVMLLEIYAILLSDKSVTGNKIFVDSTIHGKIALYSAEKRSIHRYKIATLSKLQKYNLRWIEFGSKENVIIGF